MSVHRQRPKQAAYEKEWPPTTIFNLMDDEITKYKKRGDRPRLDSLMSRVRRLDGKLKRIHSRVDWVEQFGAEKAAELMVFYVALNGTLRSRLNKACVGVRSTGDVDII